MLCYSFSSMWAQAGRGAASGKPRGWGGKEVYIKRSCGITEHWDRRESHRARLASCPQQHVGMWFSSIQLILEDLSELASRKKKQQVQVSQKWCSGQHKKLFGLNPPGGVCVEFTCSAWVLSEWTGFPPESKNMLIGLQVDLTDLLNPFWFPW